jgi:hypothetical protein
MFSAYLLIKNIAVLYKRMKLSRTKIARLLKSKNQSRKSKSKSLGHKGFRVEELLSGVAKPKSLHHVKKRQRTAHLKTKPINLRLKTMKGWHKKPAAWHKPGAGYDKKQSGGAPIKILNSLGLEKSIDVESGLAALDGNPIFQSISDNPDQYVITANNKLVGDGKSLDADLKTAPDNSQFRHKNYWFLHRMLNGDLYYLLDTADVGKVVQLMINDTSTNEDNVLPDTALQQLAKSKGALSASHGELAKTKQEIQELKSKNDASAKEIAALQEKIGIAMKEQEKNDRLVSEALKNESLMATNAQKEFDNAKKAKAALAFATVTNRAALEAAAQKAAKIAEQTEFEQNKQEDKTAEAVEMQMKAEREIQLLKEQLEELQEELKFGQREVAVENDDLNAETSVEYEEPVPLNDSPYSDLLGQANEIDKSEIGSENQEANEIGQNEIGQNEIGQNKKGPKEMSASEIAARDATIQTVYDELVQKELAQATADASKKADLQINEEIEARLKADTEGMNITTDKKQQMMQESAIELEPKRQEMINNLLNLRGSSGITKVIFQKAYDSSAEEERQKDYFGKLIKKRFPSIDQINIDEEWEDQKRNNPNLLVDQRILDQQRLADETRKRKEGPVGETVNRVNEEQELARIRGMKGLSAEEQNIEFEKWQKAEQQELAEKQRTAEANRVGDLNARENWQNKQAEMAKAQDAASGYIDLGANPQPTNFGDNNANLYGGGPTQWKDEYRDLYTVRANAVLPQEGGANENLIKRADQEAADRAAYEEDQARQAQEQEEQAQYEANAAEEARATLGKETADAMIAKKMGKPKTKRNWWGTKKAPTPEQQAAHDLEIAEAQKEARNQPLQEMKKNWRGKLVPVNPAKGKRAAPAIPAEPDQPPPLPPSLSGTPVGTFGALTTIKTLLDIVGGDIINEPTNIPEPEEAIRIKNAIRAALKNINPSQIEIVERLELKNALQKINYFYQRFPLEEYALSLGDQNPLKTQAADNFDKDKEILNKLIQTFLSYYGPLIYGGGRDPKVGVLQYLLFNAKSIPMSNGVQLLTGGKQSGGTPLANMMFFRFFFTIPEIILAWKDRKSSKSSDAQPGAEPGMQPGAEPPPYIPPPFAGHPENNLLKCIKAIETKINEFGDLPQLWADYQLIKSSTLQKMGQTPNNAIGQIFKEQMLLQAFIDVVVYTTQIIIRGSGYAYEGEKLADKFFKDTTEAIGKSKEEKETQALKKAVEKATGLYFKGLTETIQKNAADIKKLADSESVEGLSDFAKTQAKEVGLQTGGASKYVAQYTDAKAKIVAALPGFDTVPGLDTLIFEALTPEQTARIKTPTKPGEDFTTNVKNIYDKLTGDIDFKKTQTDLNTALTAFDPTIETEKSTFQANNSLLNKKGDAILTEADITKDNTKTDIVMNTAAPVESASEEAVVPTVDPSSPGSAKTEEDDSEIVKPELDLRQGENAGEEDQELGGGAESPEQTALNAINDIKVINKGIKVWEDEIARLEKTISEKTATKPDEANPADELEAQLAALKVKQAAAETKTGEAAPARGDPKAVEKLEAELKQKQDLLSANKAKLAGLEAETDPKKKEANKTQIASLTTTISDDETKIADLPGKIDEAKAALGAADTAAVQGKATEEKTNIDAEIAKLEQQIKSAKAKQPASKADTAAEEGEIKTAKEEIKRLSDLKAQVLERQTGAVKTAMDNNISFQANQLYAAANMFSSAVLDQVIDDVPALLAPSQPIPAGKTEAEKAAEKAAKDKAAKDKAAKDKAAKDKTDKAAKDKAAKDKAAAAFSDASLLAKMAKMQAEIDALKETKDSADIGESEASIQAIMTGDDAVAHQVKFLVDIPKWQQFKVIESGGTTVEESLSGFSLSRLKATLAETQKKINAVFDSGAEKFKRYQGEKDLATKVQILGDIQKEIEELMKAEGDKKVALMSADPTNKEIEKLTEEVEKHKKTIATLKAAIVVESKELAKKQAGTGADKVPPGAAPAKADAKTDPVPGADKAEPGADKADPKAAPEADKTAPGAEKAEPEADKADPKAAPEADKTAPGAEKADTAVKTGGTRKKLHKNKKRTRRQRGGACPGVTEEEKAACAAEAAAKNASPEVVADNTAEKSEVVEGTTPADPKNPAENASPPAEVVEGTTPADPKNPAVVEGTTPADPKNPADAGNPAVVAGNPADAGNPATAESPILEPGGTTVVEDPTQVNADPEKENEPADIKSVAVVDSIDAELSKYPGVKEEIEQTTPASDAELGPDGKPKDPAAPVAATETPAKDPAAPVVSTEPVVGKQDAPIEGKQDAPIEGKQDAPIEGKQDAPIEGKQDAPIVDPPATEVGNPAAPEAEKDAPAPTPGQVGGSKKKSSKKRSKRHSKKKSKKRRHRTKKYRLRRI